MRNDMITEFNNTGYVLTKEDKDRIKLLKDEIDSNGIKFKYFLTVDYYFKMTDTSRLIQDNHHLYTLIRSFYKSDIRMFFFNEKHLKNPSSKNYGGFHRHILIEDAPEHRWKNPTKQLSHWLKCLTSDEVQKFHEYFVVDAFLPLKLGLMRKVVRRLHRSTPTGEKGMRLLPVNNIDGLLSYCTKQRKGNIPHDYVIDTSNSSGLDDKFIRRLHAYLRQKATSHRVD